VPAVALNVIVPDLSPLVRGGNETILVAEDEASLRYLASTVLERLGYTVILAEDGLEAVNLFRVNQARIDLVILDLVMPRFSGRDALELMRAIRPDLRALFVTGYDDAAAHVPGVDALVSDTNLLQKPYRVDTLGLRVRELLD
jgi:CheY-like chemotaxis protein